MHRRYRFRSLPHEGSSLGISRQSRTVSRIRICRKKLFLLADDQGRILEAAKLFAAFATLGYAFGFVLSNVMTFVFYKFIDLNLSSACCVGMTSIFVAFILGVHLFTNMRKTGSR